MAGRSVAIVTATGSDTVTVVPFALTVKLVVPVGASFGTSRRSSSVTLALVAGMAAAIGWPLPIRVAVQPDGTPATDSSSRSGGSA